MKKMVCICWVFLLFAVNVYAQERVVHGMVTTFDSIPLIGVEIQIKSTGQIVFTDSAGTFSVACNKEDKLKIRANGFYNSSLNLNEKTKFAAINLKLKPGEKQREYAIGYGHVSEKDLANAVTSLNQNDMKFSRFNDIFDIIRSMGVEVVNNEVHIRGDKSFQGNNAALLVVDGVIVDADFLKTIKPIHVKSIDIIRDGASSVYGSRGANGVVVVQTLGGR
ncbi:MAG: TonB-dependent receptor plug domain-containing protein [Prolixibacteraceae bacterium]|nr:TonB-dependent receptor plug domain-containing protein [Prolixibacteraceae bacterium]